MTEETYNRLKDIKRDIAHIDEVIMLCESILDNPGHEGYDKKAVIKEIGFISHPREVYITNDELIVIIEAFYKKRERLQNEFNNI